MVKKKTRLSYLSTPPTDNDGVKTTTVPKFAPSATDRTTSSPPRSAAVRPGTGGAHPRPAGPPPPAGVTAVTRRSPAPLDVAGRGHAPRREVRLIVVRGRDDLAFGGRLLVRGSLLGRGSLLRAGGWVLESAGDGDIVTM